MDINGNTTITLNREEILTIIGALTDKARAYEALFQVTSLNASVSTQHPVMRSKAQKEFYDCLADRLLDSYNDHEPTN